MIATYTPDSPEPFEINDADIRHIIDVFAKNDGYIVRIFDDPDGMETRITADEKTYWIQFWEIAEFVAEYVDEIRPEMREMLIRDEWAFNPMNVTPEIAREILAI